MRWAAASLVVAAWAAGCAQETVPFGPAPIAPAPVEDFAFEWNSTDALGDWYMHLRLDAPAETGCKMSLSGHGHASADQETVQMGWNGSFGPHVAWHSRSGWVGAEAGGVASSGVTDDVLGEGDYGDFFYPFETHIRLRPGLNLVFWAGSGVGDDGGQGPTFKAALDCDGPANVTERAVGRDPILFRETTGSGMEAQTLGLALTAKGEFDYAPGGNRTLFAVSATFAEGGSVVLDDSEGTHVFELASNGRNAMLDAGSGPMHLAIDWPAKPPSLYLPHMTGILASYDVVEAFPASS